MHPLLPQLLWSKVQNEKTFGLYTNPEAGQHIKADHNFPGDTGQLHRDLI